jgi:hypothetical protein
VQVVLRLYRTISEIAVGFDVDSSCCLYDGKYARFPFLYILPQLMILIGHRVYLSPRAIIALMTRCNMVDLTRRSLSYEARLIKYRSRGFEIEVPWLERSKIDPRVKLHPYLI